MYRRAESYHPSQIFKEKRIQRSSGKSVGEELVSANKNSIDPEEKKRARPEGLGGVIYDAWEYLTEGMEAIKKFNGLIANLDEQLNLGLDLKLADADRKIPNKKFQKIKQEIEKLARGWEFHGDHLFSGKFRDRAKTLQIGETEVEVMTLRIDPLHLEGLKLDRTHIDSLPAAKKSADYIAKAKSQIGEVESSFKAKVETLAYKLAQFEKSSELEEQARNGSKVSSEKVLKSMRFEDLRIHQERAAEKTGRTLALLVNILA